MRVTQLSLQRDRHGTNRPANGQPQHTRMRCVCLCKRCTVNLFAACSNQQTARTSSCHPAECISDILRWLMRVRAQSSARRCLCIQRGAAAGRMQPTRDCERVKRGSAPQGPALERSRVHSAIIRVWLSLAVLPFDSHPPAVVDDTPADDSSKAPLLLPRPPRPCCHRHRRSVLTM